MAIQMTIVSNLNSVSDICGYKFIFSNKHEINRSVLRLQCGQTP